LKDIINRAINLADSRKVQYADIRVVQNLTETIVVKDGSVTTPDFSETIGFGVRVLFDGGWGFASSNDLSDQEVDRVTDLAFKIARASGGANGGNVELGPAVTSQGTYKTPFEIDPFSLSKGEAHSLSKLSMKRVVVSRQ
jgi:TldD protein